MSAPDIDGRSADSDAISRPALTLIASTSDDAPRERETVEAPPLVPDLEDDEFMLNIEDLDPEECPPDMRFFLGDREAWVYDHGDVVDLVFVRLPG